MSHPQYTLEGYRSNDDSRWYGTLDFGGSAVAALSEGEDRGMRTEKDLQAWAEGAGAEHKAETTAAPLHRIKKVFTV